MTQEISGIIRHVLTFGGGFAVNAGYLAQDELTAVVGAIVTLVGLVWSVVNKRNAK